MKFRGNKARKTVGAKRRARRKVARERGRASGMAEVEEA